MVELDSGSEAEAPGAYPVWANGPGLAAKASTERGIERFLEGDASFLRGLPELDGQVRVDVHGRSHDTSLHTPKTHQYASRQRWSHGLLVRKDQLHREGGEIVAEQFDAVDVIRTKRDGGTLSDAQIDWVVDAYTRAVVADEQMAALAMAVFLNGMNRAEVFQWTEAMIRSGTRMDWSSLDRSTVDKHSTGGVGDKITLPLAPLVAACGAAVPQLSGRGLGHTGGTLDKLESIAGWRDSLTED